MATTLDMSLDDIIKSSKKSGGGRGRSRGGGGGGRGRGGAGRVSVAAGPTRRFQNRRANRPTPYQAVDQGSFGVVSPAMNGGRQSSMETGTKLYISNLDYGVSNEDIKELFSELGDLKRHSIHYDRSGRSKGTAEVVFSRHQDAVAAVKRYNNVQLDGKSMMIEIVGKSLATPNALLPVRKSMFKNPNAPKRSIGERRGGATGRLRGGVGGRGGNPRRGRGRGRGRSAPVSLDDLNADLEKYHSEAMQIN